MSKCKSLEEVIKSSSKMEAWLIGYDEAPSPFISSDTDSLVYSPGPSDINSEHSIEKEITNLDSANSLCVRRLNQGLSCPDEVATEPLSESSRDNCRDAEAVTSGTLQ